MSSHIINRTLKLAATMFATGIWVGTAIWIIGILFIQHAVFAAVGILLVMAAGPGHALAVILLKETEKEDQ